MRQMWSEILKMRPEELRKSLKYFEKNRGNDGKEGTKGTVEGISK